MPPQGGQTSSDKKNIKQKVRGEADETAQVLGVDCRILYVHAILHRLQT